MQTTRVKSGNKTAASTKIFLDSSLFQKMAYFECEELTQIERLESVKKEEKNTKSDCLLFARPDGLPMYFFMKEVNDDIKKRIEEKGGVLLHSGMELLKGENCIRLCSDKLENMMTNVEQFDEKFIEDCLKNDQIMELINYRINFSSIYDEYDPLDILLGYKTWDQIILTEDNSVEEISKEDDGKREIDSQPNLYAEDDLIPEDDILARGSYCVVEPPIEWEIMTEDEALSYGINCVVEPPIEWEIMTEDEALSFGISYEKGEPL